MESFKDALIDLLKSFGLVKSKDSPQEQMISYEVVYEPNVKDAHGEWMSVETVQKACEDFNKNLKEGKVVPNLFHITETDKFSIEDSWIQKEFDVTVAETGEPIKAGTWVAKIKYHDDDLWQLKKMGEIQGVSIGARGVVNEETGELTDISFDFNEDEEE